jgi:hypothetical protein
MSVGDRHTLNGYSFIETLYGPFGPDRCVNCGTATLSVVPTGRIGAGGMLEDTGGGIASRCSACGRVHHGVNRALPASAVKGVPFLIDAAARVANAQPVAPPAVPEPEHTSRQPVPAGVPRALGSNQLAKLAETHGWTVDLTYARGPWLAGNGTVARIAHTFAVRGRLAPSPGTHTVIQSGPHAGTGVHLLPVPPRQFHALYVRPVVEREAGAAWKCDHAMLLPIDPEGIFPHVSVNDLKEWISAYGDMPPEWYEAIRARLAAQKAAAKEKAKVRPKKIREDHA